MNLADELVNAGIAFSDAKNPKKAVHAPVTLRHSYLPSGVFMQAANIQPLFNKLIYNCVQQRHLLEEVCYELAADGLGDSFVLRLFDIWKRCQFKLPEIFFNINRSDYMLDESECLHPKLRQVELNTISVSLVGLGPRVSYWHKSKYPEEETFNFPENKAVENIGEAFRKAFMAYTALYNVSPHSAHILMLIHPKERNIYDQQCLIDSINMPGNVHRAYLNDSFAIDSETGKLLWNDKEIAIVYYRTGYDPNDYDQTCWDMRLLIEQSRTVKCPDIAAHLTGLKKMQQVLCQEQELSKIISDPAERATLRSCFAGIYALDDKDAVSRAIQSPENFVLKPQREGGGHNIYNEKVREALLTKSVTELQSFILMERIRPLPRITSIVKDGQIYPDIETISELGIFGVYLQSRDTYINEAAGHVLRTKPADNDEGGVVAGFSAIDSVRLL